MALTLKIVTPEKIVFNEQIDSIYVPTDSGEIGILPHHVSMITKVIPGELRIKRSGKDSYFATGDGFIEIKDNTITLLTDLAIDEKDIDEKTVEDARRRAQLALEQTLSDEEYAETFAVLEKSIAQLRLKRRHR